MIDTEKLDNCCGCQSCKLICPTNAISMFYDDKGFIYPKINSKLCIHCNLCESVCNFINHNDGKNTIINQYAFQINDKYKLYNSTSGGAFTMLSDYILSNNGFIVGTIMDNDMKTKYIIGNTEKTRDNMRGSKYVQSLTGNIFKEIYILLKKGNKVLFIGTPCHVGALYSFLKLKKIKLDNLYTIDFICHGVQSEKIFKEHINYLERKFNSKIINYNFRDKKYGWCHTETATFINGKQKSDKSVFRLKELFQKNIDLRDSCYCCVYSNKNRVSDITIGDFWGADELLKKYDFKGVSLILTNTNKGENLLKNSLKKYKYAYFVKSTNHILNQGGLNKAAEKSIDSDNFWKLYFEKGYLVAINKYAYISNQYMIYVYLKRLIHFFRLDSFFIKLKFIIKDVQDVNIK